jgi:hypothetical protein
MKNDMKNSTLKKFTIWMPTEFGIGCQEKKAKDFTAAFCRLGKKDQMKDGWITDEDGEMITFNAILGIEQN